MTLLLHIFLFAEGVVANVYRYTLDSGAGHALAIFDFIYYIFGFVLYLEISRPLLHITHFSNKFLTGCQLFGIILGVALTGGAAIAVDDGGPIQSWKPYASIYYLFLIIFICMQNLYIWYRCMDLLYNSKEFDRVLNFQLKEQFKRSFSPVALFLVLDLIAGAFYFGGKYINVVTPFENQLQIELPMLVRITQIFFVTSMTKYDERIQSLNFRSINRRMINIRRIDCEKQSQTEGQVLIPKSKSTGRTSIGSLSLPAMFNIKGSSGSLTNSRGSKGGINSSYNSIHKQSMSSKADRPRVHFASTIAKIIRFDENNKVAEIIFREDNSPSLLLKPQKEKSEPNETRNGVKSIKESVIDEDEKI
ncbi:hypothetical protein HDV06_002500 [Boothiomyces sp. JEL0866]|nr:hypothetical protein HDV06_002500 [Boothiomyces sp. JEL0866]